MTQIEPRALGLVPWEFDVSCYCCNCGPMSICLNMVKCTPRNSRAPTPRPLGLHLVCFRVSMLWRKRKHAPCPQDSRTMGSPRIQIL